MSGATSISIPSESRGEKMVFASFNFIEFKMKIACFTSFYIFQIMRPLFWVFFVPGVRVLKAIMKTQNCFLALTGSRRSSSASRGAVLAFGCTSSLHSLSEAGGDSARSGKSSLVLGPRKRILSRRFSMVNTAHLGFTLTWWTATL